jgi:hypothetical protein
MAYYEPLTINSIPPYSESPYTVNFRPANYLLENSYIQNSTLIDTLANLIAAMTADSLAQIEVVQLVGYTAPNEKQQGLGMKRATSLRDKLKYYCNLPDSIFEIADGGNNWNMIYADIRELGTPGGESLIASLKSEPDARTRERMLKKYQGGTLYRELTERMFPAHRMACCTGIYYHNKPDSIAIAINSIVDELMNNPKPDYSKLIGELKHFRNDPRALNLQGVIEYRRHHRHAAEQAFARAAAMGDEQAAVNLQIVRNNKYEE